ncbi:Sulfatase [Hexamita inflata]|uniref:Sulfatase n=1 Tax=Hexamita inflata TaxID=28002 RepID=A0AA86Q1M8_9EUKA|nr:Sulfatase [Hexamita inflata]
MRVITHQMYVAISTFLATMVLTGLKFFDWSTSESQIVSDQDLFILCVFLYLLDMACFCFAHIVLTRVSNKIWYRVPISTVFSIYYLLIIFTCAVDEENSKEMQQLASQYYYEVYYFRKKPLFNDELSIKGAASTTNVASNVLVGLIQRSPVHWIILFVGAGLIIVFFITCLVRDVMYKFKENKKQIAIKQSNHESTRIEFQTEVLLATETYERRKKLSRSKKLLYSTSAAVILANVVAFIVFMTVDSPTYRMAAPAHWNFYKSHLIPKMSAQKYEKAVTSFRNNNQLKSGYDWIDQRTTPEFPMVYAPKKTVCSYNPELSYCAGLPNDPVVTPTADLPNIVVVIIESFTPGPTMIQDNVVESQAKIVDGPLYKSNYLPKLRELSESGVAFSSLASSGLPTLLGWHSLVTGEIPYSNSINMVQSIYNDVDDFPSFFRQQGYHSMYVSPSPFAFDGKNNWIFRGKDLTSSDPDKLSSIPLWFDEVYQYYPTDEQAQKLNVESTTFKQWIPDRITAAQFQTYFDEAKQKQTKPIFGVWATVDTHMPFTGQDDLQFYESFKFGKGVEGSEVMSEKIDRYTTVAKYADNYIGQVADYLKQHHNNTIMVILGDHGAREVPLYKDEQVDKLDPNSATYDDSCNHQPFSNDQLYTTSAVISYFGDNQALKDKFDPLKSKVVKVPTDHHDMIRTIYDLSEEMTGKHLASSRNGRNLLELATNLTSGKSLRKHWSLRATSLHSELATEDTVYRYHTLGPKGQIFNGIYPTCVTGEERNWISENQYQEFRQYHSLYDQVQRNNKQFSYQFRNEACSYPTLCNFPDNMKAYNNNQPMIYLGIIIGAGLGLGLVIAFIRMGISFTIEKVKAKKMQKK